MFKNIEFAGSNVQGEWYSQGELKGRASLDELIIDGEILSQNSIIYDELFDSVRGKYKLSRGVLSLDDFFLRKSDGYIFNDFSFDLRNKSILFALNLASSPSKFSNLSTFIFKSFGLIIISEILLSFICITFVLA